MHSFEELTATVQQQNIRMIDPRFVDLSSALPDPFWGQPTLSMICSIAEMCRHIEDAGIQVKYHHHEVGAPTPTR